MQVHTKKAATMQATMSSSFNSTQALDRPRIDNWLYLYRCGLVLSYPIARMLCEFDKLSVTCLSKTIYKINNVFANHTKRVNLSNFPSIASYGSLACTMEIEHDVKVVLSIHKFTSHICIRPKITITHPGTYRLDVDITKYLHSRNTLPVANNTSMKITGSW